MSNQSIKYKLEGECAAKKCKKVPVCPGWSVGIDTTFMA